MNSITTDILHMTLNTIENTLDGLTAIRLITGPNEAVYEVVTDCTADLEALSKTIHDVLNTIAYEEMNDMYAISTSKLNQTDNNRLKNS